MPARALALIALLVAGMGPARADLEEPASETRFPEVVTLDVGENELQLVATGVGLRKKFFFKAYACASYVDAAAALGDDPARDLIELDVARQLHMHVLRNFSADKVTGAFREGFEKNDRDLMVTLSPDVERFLGFFTKDPRDGDDLRFSYRPGVGLEATHNGEALGTIEDPRFARLVWGIFFGEHPVNGDLKDGMLSRVRGS